MKAIEILKEFEDIITSSVEDGKYGIREHKKKGLLTPANQPRPFREDVSISDREKHIAVS